MATPQEKLATSLEALRQLQDRSGMVVRSDDLSRTLRQRLVDNGFLLEVMRSWYIVSVISYFDRLASRLFDGLPNCLPETL